MRVNVRATGNVLNRFADGPAVFEDRFVFGQIAQRDLVAERNIIEQFDFLGGFAFQSYRADGAAFFQVQDGDTDVILGFVQKNSMLHNSRRAQARYNQGKLVNRFGPVPQDFLGKREVCTPLGSD